ncbi:MAG: 3-dehydroquinate dehydratase [Flavobacteriales bacterium]|nr:3-dehydroquinate dehydratase [Flavobacteriales bacterium]
MSKRIIIINGPNLNLLGKREPEKYGYQDFESYFMALRKSYSDIRLDYFQSNVEGELINKLHETGFAYDGIVMNPGGYSHTSVSLADAIAAIQTKVIEVHITNIHAREDYRHHTLTGAKCSGIISGFGLVGYEMAIEYFLSL